MSKAGIGKEQQVAGRYLPIYWPSVQGGRDGFEPRKGPGPPAVLCCSFNPTTIRDKLFHFLRQMCCKTKRKGTFWKEKYIARTNLLLARCFLRS
jgi:hypothetical protein